MTAVTLVGLDPGFANLGWCVMRCAGPTLELQACGVFTTEQSDKKRKVLAADDNVRRAVQIANFLAENAFTPVPVVICAEAMSFPRNSSAAAKMAMCWGAVATFSAVHRIPITQASPKEIKQSLCSSATASKEQVEEAVRVLYPGVDSFLEGKVPPSNRNHAYDAIAAVVTASRTSPIVQVLMASVIRSSQA